MGGTRRGRCQTVVRGVVPEAKHAQQEHEGGRERRNGSTWDSRRGLSRRETGTQEDQGGERHAQRPPTRRCGARSPDERTTWSVPKAKADKRRNERWNAKAPGEDDDEALECLREFDLDSRFGPCMGMTRIDRWERAEKLGLDPPPRVKTLLETRKYRGYQDCIWEGRV